MLRTGGFVSETDLLAISPADVKARHGEFCGSSLDRPLHVEFAAVTRALEELSLGVPTGATSEVGAAVVQGYDAVVTFSFDHPGLSIGDVKRNVRLKLVEHVARNLSYLLLVSAEQREATHPPRSSESHGSSDNEEKLLEKPSLRLGPRILC